MRLIEQPVFAKPTAFIYVKAQIISEFWPVAIQRRVTSCLYQTIITPTSIQFEMAVRFQYISLAKRGRNSRPSSKTKAEKLKDNFPLIYSYRCHVLPFGPSPPLNDVLPLNLNLHSLQTTESSCLLFYLFTNSC